jgi:hypothetical protein
MFRMKNSMNYQKSLFLPEHCITEGKIIVIDLFSELLCQKSSEFNTHNIWLLKGKEMDRSPL